MDLPIKGLTVRKNNKLIQKLILSYTIDIIAFFENYF